MYRSTHHPFSPPLLHTNTLHTTVNPATAYASSLDTKSYTGEFVLSITFRRRLLHAVSYASLLPLSLYASLHVRHLVLHRRPIVAQQILRQLVLLLPLSLQQPLLPTVHPLRRAHIDFRLLRFPLARRDSSFRFFRCSARERPSSACISFPVSTNCSISCFCCITFRRRFSKSSVWNSFDGFPSPRDAPPLPAPIGPIGPIGPIEFETLAAFPAGSTLELIEFIELIEFFEVFEVGDGSETGSPPRGRAPSPAVLEGFGSEEESESEGTSRGEFFFFPKMEIPNRRRFFFLSRGVLTELSSESGSYE